MLIGGTSCQCTYRINDDHARALTLSFAQERHDMGSGAGRIAAPDQDQLAMKEHLR